MLADDFMVKKVKCLTDKDDWASSADVARRESLVLTLCP